MPCVKRDIRRHRNVLHSHAGWRTEPPCRRSASCNGAVSRQRRADRLRPFRGINRRRGHLYCKSFFTESTPVSKLFLDQRSTQLCSFVDRLRCRCLQCPTCGQVSCTPTILPHPQNTRKNLLKQKLTLGRLQNCVFRQLVLNPSKNWLSTSQHFLTRSLVQLVTFTVHSYRAFTFAL